MIVWITHAKVGHRQTPYKHQTRPRAGFGVYGVCVTCLSLRQHAPQAPFDMLRTGLLRRTLTCACACYVVAKVGHPFDLAQDRRQTPYKHQTRPRAGFGVYGVYKAGCFAL